jgi:membrane-associated phospholipid phosphatase
MLRIRKGFPVGATALVLVWITDLVWAGHVGLSLTELGVVVSTLVLLGGNWWLYRSMRGGERARELARGVTIFVAYGSGLTLLSYLTLTLHMPLADARLAGADAAMGFDWLAWYHFVHNHKLLNALLQFAYRTLAPQMAIALFALPLSGMTVRNRAFLWTTALSLAATVALSALCPAESAWVWHQASDRLAPGPLEDFLAMRSGRMTVLDVQQMRGLITFPSFHAEMAVVLAWCARGTQLAALAVVLNALMIVSTLSVGGHYLSDTLAGCVLAGASIAVCRRFLVRPERVVALGDCV